MFVWTCTSSFWQACSKNACKSTEDLLCSESENDSNAIFSEKKFFPHFAPPKIEKNLHPDTQNAVVTTLPEVSRQTSENIARTQETKKKW